MASGEGKPNPSAAAAGGGVAKGRKRKYLPHGKPVRKGAYPLRPGVQGFFITCDGGRERQATREALSLLDSFYEDLVDGKGSDEKPKSIPDKPLNKKITFEDTDSSDDEDEKHSEEVADDANNTGKGETTPSEQLQEVVDTPVVPSKDNEERVENADESKVKKQRVEDPPISEQTEPKEIAERPTESTDKAKGSNDKPIDELIDEDLKELGDRKKRLFATLDSGCNGCIFIQMHKRDGDPGPVEIVQNMMSSAASTRKHMSRFILRVLPTEVTCYASEEEITKAIIPLVEKYFPKESSSIYKFAVLYEARSNTGIDRMKIINTVAKSVPQPHKVDLNNPDRTIIVQIAKTICMIGVVERYKELSKFNLRQLTSPPQK
ncbi:THUMP domain-containing protein 1 homolog [Oryza brachyantha]|uniref:THUMP domain-containing protein n=1 Tax=Oryza brachyantha TaxID=4533 RepID=J3N934_ORYBR|nr:THUMP domain-containing protein 1 homolog [Oryza brachyantha]